MKVRISTKTIQCYTASLEKSFGSLVAVDDVSIAVERGSITEVTGPNGTGKSTLLNLISGFYDCDAGRVTVNEVDVSGNPPHEVVRAGLV